MKKIITLAALMVTMLTSFSFAADSTNGIDQASTAVKASFKRDFKNTQLLGTEVHKTFTKLTFRMNEVVLFAFYSDNGDLLAVTRNILSTQLPLTLQMGLKSNYDGYWITELFEINGDSENAYYVTLENADQKITLRSNANQTWDLYEKTSKQ